MASMVIYMNKLWKVLIGIFDILQGTFILTKSECCMLFLMYVQSYMILFSWHLHLFYCIV